MSEILKNIDRRINDLWSAGHYTDAYAIIAEELIPAIIDYVVSKFGLTKEDAEDVVGDARQGFLKVVSAEGPHSIAAPKPYLWQAATTRAIDYKRKLKEADIPESDLVVNRQIEPSGPHVHLDNQFYDGVTKGLIPTWQMRVTFLVEGLISDVEIKSSDAVTLVNETLKRLKPPNAEIISYILEHGHDQCAAEAARSLRLTVNNFRVRKHRAYHEFRKIAPQVASDLKIQWRGIAEEPASFDAIEIPEFVPSEDESTEE